MGSLADRPDPSKVPTEGTFYQVDNTDDLFLLAIDPKTGVHSWLSVTGSGPTSAVSVGIDSVNGNDSNPGTLALPVKTWDRAYQVYLSQAAMGPPRFVDVNPTGSTVAFTQDYYLFGSQGFSTQQPAFIGVPKDSGLGAVTVDVVGTANLYGGPFVTALSLKRNGVSLTLVKNAYQGLRFRFTSGALAGMSFDLNSNTTSQLVFQLIIGASSGDTGVIESCGTTIQIQSTPTSEVVVAGDPAMHAVRFQMVSNTNLRFTGNVQLGFVEFDHNHFIHTNFVFEGRSVKLDAAFQNVAGLPTADFDNTFFIHNSMGEASMWIRSGAVAEMPAGVFVDASLLISGGGSVANIIAFPTFFFDAPFTKPAVVMNLSSGLLGSSAFQLGTDIQNPGTGDGISITSSILYMQAGGSVAVGGNGLVLNGGSQAWITGLVGVQTGAGKVGLVTTVMDLVKVADPAIGTTITGPGGDVVVGDNAVIPGKTATATWNDISAGTAAKCTAAGALCRVHA